MQFFPSNRTHYQCSDKRKTQRTTSHPPARLPLVHGRRALRFKGGPARARIRSSYRMGTRRQDLVCILALKTIPNQHSTHQVQPQHTPEPAAQCITQRALAAALPRMHATAPPISWFLALPPRSAASPALSSRGCCWRSGMLPEGRGVQHIVPGLGAQPMPHLKSSLAPGLAPAMPTPALLRLRLRSVARFASRLVEQRHLLPILCGRGSQLCAVYHCRLRSSDSAAGDGQRRQLQRRAHARAAEQPRLHNGPQVGRAPVHPQALRG